MTLVGNRTFIQRIQASVGVAITSDSEDPAYINFNQVIFLFYIIQASVVFPLPVITLMSDDSRTADGTFLETLV